MQEVYQTSTVLITVCISAVYYEDNSVLLIIDRLNIKFESLKAQLQLDICTVIVLTCRIFPDLQAISHSDSDLETLLGPFTISNRIVP